MSWLAQQSQFELSKQSALRSTMWQAETARHFQQLHIQQLAPMRPQLSAEETAACWSALGRAHAEAGMKTPV